MHDCTSSASACNQTSVGSSHRNERAVGSVCCSAFCSKACIVDGERSLHDIHATPPFPSICARPPASLKMLRLGARAVAAVTSLAGTAPGYSRYSAVSAWCQPGLFACHCCGLLLLAWQGIGCHDSGLSMRSKTDDCSRTLVAVSPRRPQTERVPACGNGCNGYLICSSVLLQVLSCFLLAKELARLGIIRDDESSSNRIYAPYHGSAFPHAAVRLRVPRASNRIKH